MKRRSEELEFQSWSVEIGRQSSSWEIAAKGFCNMRSLGTSCTIEARLQDIWETGGKVKEEGDDTQQGKLGEHRGFGSWTIRGCYCVT